MSGTRWRLERLEEQMPINWERAEEPWPVEDQLDAITWELQVQEWGRSVYQATDREIALCGVVHAYQELGGKSGTWETPSGARVFVEDHRNGTHSFRVEGAVAVEDLPEDTGRLLERMDPTKQPKRERLLYESREGTKRWDELARRRIAWHRDNGWDRPTPRNLLPDGDEVAV